MASAEHFILSLTEEPSTLHVLLWDDQDDLSRVLVFLSPTVIKRGVISLLVSPAALHIAQLQSLVKNRPSPDAIVDDSAEAEVANRLWLLFIQQGTASQVGPWLNGYRRPLAQGGGALLIVREAEFLEFQRSAPDLTSFAGPRIYNASSMLFLVPAVLFNELVPVIPEDIDRILEQLPGTRPTKAGLEDWLAAIEPSSSE